MVAAAKENLGFMPCPNCKHPVALKKSTKTETVPYDCQHADCEATGYAKKHQKAAATWLAAVGKGANPAPVAAKPAGVTQPTPAPEKTPQKAGFSFGGLAG
jgi:hypothetical protein